MYSDPLVLGMTVSTAAVTGSAQNFVRNGGDNNQSIYRLLDADANDYILKFGHQYGKTRSRYTVRCDLKGLVPSTSVPSEMASFSQSCYAVFDCPLTGPIVNTTTVTTLDRRLCNIIGQLLLGGIGTDGSFLARSVKLGET